MAASPPTFEQWRDDATDEILGSDFSLAAIVVDELSAMDLIFVLLGVVTAYQVVSRRSQEQTA